MQVNDCAGPAVAEWAAKADFRMFVGQHQRDRTKLQLGVGDTTAGLRHAKRFLRAEHSAVEIDGGLAIVNTQVDEHFVNRGHCGASARSHTPPLPARCGSTEAK